MATAVVKPIILEPKKRTEYMREYFRERYNSDPEFRRRRLEIIKTCQKKHPEYHKKDIERQKDRYKNDPEYRAKCLQRAKQQYQKKKATKSLSPPA